MTGGQRPPDCTLARLYIVAKSVYDALEGPGLCGRGDAAEGLCRQLFLGFSPEEQERFAQLLRKVYAALR